MTKRERPPRTGQARSTEPTLIEEFEAHPRGAQEMAAARLAQDVNELLNRALAQTGLRQTDLARIVGVTPGRVSQILTEGNLRVSSIAKYARALGFQPQISLQPVVAGRVAIAASHSTPVLGLAKEWRKVHVRAVRDQPNRQEGLVVDSFDFKPVPGSHSLGYSKPGEDVLPPHLTLLASSA